MAPNLWHQDDAGQAVGLRDAAILRIGQARFPRTQAAGSTGNVRLSAAPRSRRDRPRDLRRDISASGGYRAVCPRRRQYSTLTSK